MKFSVTIPAYKQKYLKEAISSVLAQTYQYYELIVVDDCSPEDLKSIVGQFKDSRIRYYRNDKNCGAENVTDNWNICLGYCTGEWVICMGDDDLLMPSCLEEYAKAISSNLDIDAFHVRTRLIDEHGHFIRLCPDRPERTGTYGNIIHSLEGRQHYLGDYCFKVARLREEGGYYKTPYAWGADDLTSFVMSSPNGIFNINEPLFCYRDNSLSISSSSNEESKLKSIFIVEKWIKDYVLNQIPSCEKQQDELKTIMALLPIFVNSFRVKHISLSIGRKKSRIFYWWRNRKRYGATRKMIIKIAVSEIYKNVRSLIK